MKRDWDLIRTILLHIEAQPAGHYTDPPAVDGVDRATVIEHVQLLIHAGFLDGIVSGTAGGMSVQIKGLRQRGSEFLYLALEDAIWNRAKEIAGAQAATMAPEAFAYLLKAVQGGAGNL